MTPTRKRRLAMVSVLVLGVGTAAAITIATLQDNMMYFMSPMDVHAETVEEGRTFRLGGLVADESVKREPDGLSIRFDVTDGYKEVPVIYTGILPDLFREGQGVIAHGSLDANGLFRAHEVLARHDETYMPPEVAKALERAGHPSSD